jgi:hypothetical protein
MPLDTQIGLILIRSRDMAQQKITVRVHKTDHKPGPGPFKTRDTADTL